MEEKRIDEKLLGANESEEIKVLDESKMDELDDSFLEEVSGGANNECPEYFVGEEVNYYEFKHVYKAKILKKTKMDDGRFAYLFETNGLWIPHDYVWKTIKPKTIRV